ALRAGVGFTAAALIFAAILCSLSRTGLAASVSALILMGTLAAAGRFSAKRTAIVVIVLSLAAALGLAVFAPAQVVLRFADISDEDRLNVWRDTVHLIAAYPVFGCGLGGYPAAFEKFKTSAFDLVQDYAHNDYLQY